MMAVTGFFDKGFGWLSTRKCIFQNMKNAPVLVLKLLGTKYCLPSTYVSSLASVALIDREREYAPPILRVGLVLFSCTHDPFMGSCDFVGMCTRQSSVSSSVVPHESLK